MFVSVHFGACYSCSDRDFHSRAPCLLCANKRHFTSFFYFFFFSFPTVKVRNSLVHSTLWVSLSPSLVSHFFNRCLYSPDNNNTDREESKEGRSYIVTQRAHATGREKRTSKMLKERHMKSNETKKNSKMNASLAQAASRFV